MIGLLKIAGAAAAAAILAYAGGYHHGHVQGRAAERIAIERATDEAAAKSEDARDRVNACYDTGGVWLRSQGRCVQGVPR
jgi:hypothetical protein